MCKDSFSKIWIKGSKSFNGIDYLSWLDHMSLKIKRISYSLLYTNYNFFVCYQSLPSLTFQA